MNVISRRSFVVSSAALAAGALASPAQAATGSVYIRIVSAGFIIGASGGNGVLTFGGRRYRLTIGGVSAGATIGAAGTELVGYATHLRRASDIAGVYSKVGAGASVGRGESVADLANPNGVVLRLRGRQTGLMVSLDISGMTIGIG